MSRRVLVVHLGVTGLSFVRHFARRGWAVDVVDERAAPPCRAALAAEFAAVRLRQVDDYAGLDAGGYDLVAVSSGVSFDRLPAGLPTTGDLDCFLDLYRDKAPAGCRLAGITGTNGKSTATSLAAAMVAGQGGQVAAVGNIGLPLLDAAGGWEADGWPQYILAELSSFQLAASRRELAADVACLLNVAPDHADWHGSQQAYAAAKGRIYAQAKLGVFNRADDWSTRLASAAAETVGFGGEHDQAQAGEWTVRDGRVRCAGEDDLQIDGRTCLRAGVMPPTACAALAIAGGMAAGQSRHGHLDTLARARGLPHRFAVAATADGIDFINDSKATNGAATIAALDSLAGGCVLIAGGQDKGQDFAQLACAARTTVAAAVLIGEDSASLQAALQAQGISCRKAQDMQAAVATARGLARANSVASVLLSPACASFDQYADYAQRGQAFEQAAHELAGVANAAV